MIRSFIAFLALIGERRALIWEMAKRDIAQKYAGSRLGVVWTLIHPLSLICIFWFVFGFGLKAQPVTGVPFVVWLTAGMAPWFALAEIVGESTSMITANPHLIQKIVFPSQILPLVKIVSSFLNHMIFLALLLILMLAHGMVPGLAALQFVYFYFAMTVLALGVSWITSAVNVFTRDVSQVVQLVLQIFFWFTPIIWDITIMPEAIRPFIKLNPVYYVVLGYRDSFIGGLPFWDHWKYGLYYWGVALFVFVVGAQIFRKLKPHFPDVI